MEDNVIKKITKQILAKTSIKLSGLWPSAFSISLMKRHNKIQLSAEQLLAVCEAVKRKAPCKLLVFGLGNDSSFWAHLNRGGVTVFLEDNKDWFEKITGKSKRIKAYLIHYDTKRKDWSTYLDNPSLLSMPLPGDVEREQWDVILVDAPAAYQDEHPGRMKSIFLSSKLIGHEGDIFVHDCDREVEDVYCNKFLKKENLKKEIKAKAGLLRHYQITNRRA